MNTKTTRIRINGLKMILIINMTIMSLEKDL